MALLAIISVTFFLGTLLFLTRLGALVLLPWRCTCALPSCGAATRRSEALRLEPAARAGTMRPPGGDMLAPGPDFPEAR
jgi:hypothetical protein